MIRHEEELRGKRYSFSRDFRHALGARSVPLIETELYNVSHETPVLFEKRGRDWNVVGVLADACLRRLLIGPNGEWLGAYAPFVLRVHPFRRTERDDAWEVAPEKVVGASEPGRPFFVADGSPAPEFRKVKAMLADADAGRLALAGLAEALEDARLLAPLAMVFEVEMLTDTLAPLFCVDVARLAKTKPALLADLAAGSPSALDLAFASIYSLRLLRGRFASGAAADLENRIGALIEGSFQDSRKDARSTLETPDGGPHGRAAGEPAPILGFSLDQSASIDFAGLF